MACSRIERARVMGVPMDLGSARRGVDMGPFAIRNAELGVQLASLGIISEDLGNLSVLAPENLSGNNSKQKSILEACRQIGEWTEKAVDQGVLPIILGGDHSISMGSVSGVMRGVNKKNKNPGLLWLDAHADCNTPSTTVSGNWHGMPLAHLIGQGDKDLVKMIGSGKIKPDRVVILGLRDVEKAEAQFIKQMGITAYTLRDVDELGMKQVINMALNKISLGDTEPYHVSLDLDWVDPLEAPGVGTPVRGGASFREAHLAMEMIADRGGLIGLDVVEVNPLLDKENMTAKLAVDLISSILGKKIL